jgi:hypothetical protein
LQSIRVTLSDFNKESSSPDSIRGILNIYNLAVRVR